MRTKEEALNCVEWAVQEMENTFRRVDRKQYRYDAVRQQRVRTLFLNLIEDACKDGAQEERPDALYISTVQED